MSQTNPNTNNNNGRYQNSRRGGRGREVPNGSGLGDPRNDCGNKSIAKYSFEGEMKDGPISKLTITKTGHRPSQFKKIFHALPVFCADKNYQGLDEVLRTGRDKVEDDFIPAYPDATRWSTTHHVQIASVNPKANRVPVTHKRPVTYQPMEQTIVTNVNLQKQLLSKYEHNSKNKSQEYNKFLVDKKSLITILFGQCDETT